MALWLVLLVAAVVLAILGFATAANWLFIAAIVLLVIGLIGWGIGGRSRTTV